MFKMHAQMCFFLYFIGNSIFKLRHKDTDFLENYIIIPIFFNKTNPKQLYLYPLNLAEFYQVIPRIGLAE